jgi:hypothetical protein
MADAPGSPLWPGLWSDPDLSGQVLALFRGQRDHKQGLRGAQQSSRTAANASVTELHISEAGDLQTLAELRLHERFPNAASIKLGSWSSDDPACGVEQLTDFALLTLSRLPSLARLELDSLKGLPGSSVSQALTLCPQLQDLTMPMGEWPVQAASCSCLGHAD